MALKLLSTSASRRDSVTSTVIEEGRLLARVRHPNVATVYGADRHDGRVGLWMEFIRGHTLWDLLRLQGPLAARETILIGLDLSRALSAIHAAGLLHRDIKAQNAMREEGGRIVLLDFGASREVHEETSQTDRKISGTPLYMAPEIFLGGEATARSDIYSLGVLLFYLASGSYPVSARSVAGLRAAHQRRDVKLLRDVRHDLPDSFVQIVERALAWDTKERFASAGQLEQALANALGVEGQAASPGTSEAAGTASRRGKARHPARLAIAAGLGVIALAIIVVLPWWLLSGIWRSSTPAHVSPDGPTEPAAEGSGKKTTAGAVPTGQGSTMAPASPVSSPLSTSLSRTYSVQAALYRRTDSGDERLVPGARIAQGDELFLEVEASRELYLYVLNEDERGEAYVLFPWSKSSLENPLSPGRHQLPGPPAEKPAAVQNASRILWQVTSAGGREHFLIIASPDRLTDIEADLRTVPNPQLTGQRRIATLSRSTKERIRGIGGGVVRTEAESTVGSGRIFERVKQLADQPEQARGIWIRQIDLENPLGR